jgi:hypothetical protein
MTSDLSEARLDALLDAERENTALRAEVERLRGERAAVVAWLRTRERQIENWPPGGMNEISLTYNIIADDIERGEHRREEER